MTAETAFTFGENAFVQFCRQVLNSCIKESNNDDGSDVGAIPIKLTIRASSCLLKYQPLLTACPARVSMVYVVICGTKQRI